MAKKRKWWAWIPLVGPIAEFVYAGVKHNEVEAEKASAAIDAAATTQADAVTAAQEDIGTATTTAVDAINTAATTAQEGLGAATTAAQTTIGPYSEAGKAALSRQRALLGLDGPDQQRLAVEGIAQGPEMAALSAQGENAILQGASATGGLRGGNVQGALAQFRPQLLSNLINQQYQNLSGLSGLGYNAAAQSGSYGMQGAQGMGSFGIQGATGAGTLGLQGATAQGTLAQQLAAIQAGQTLSQQQLAAQNQIDPLKLALQFGGYALGGGF